MASPLQRPAEPAHAARAGDQLSGGRVRQIDLDAVAKREGCSRRHVERMLGYAFLAPELVKAIADGRLPRGARATALADAPTAWFEQWRMIGWMRLPPAWAEQAQCIFRSDIERRFGRSSVDLVPKMDVKRLDKAADFWWKDAPIDRAVRHGPKRAETSAT